MIVINGQKFEGNNVQVTNGQVFIDGVNSTPKDVKIINIAVSTYLDTLEVDYCDSIQVTGNVGDLSTTNGNVRITGYVTGDVKSVNGEITCGNVGGKVKTINGNIKHN